MHKNEIVLIHFVLLGERRFQERYFDKYLCVVLEFPPCYIQVTGTMGMFVMWRSNIAQEGLTPIVSSHSNSFPFLSFCLFFSSALFKERNGPFEIFSRYALDIERERKGKENHEEEDDSEEDDDDEVMCAL